ncbi:hypothetical protein [Streptomyces sp. NPDC006610]|uniref:hypothetical protein n=1 Tax=Streptomyces sp. NPDC006610 TaxID=3154584 RepID=UPI00339E1A12
MGGLVVRAALHYTDEGATGFPSNLHIEDVVTLGTPHGGTGWGTACSVSGWQQCKDMKSDSPFSGPSAAACPTPAWAQTGRPSRRTTTASSPRPPASPATRSTR